MRAPHLLAATFMLLSCVPSAAFVSAARATMRPCGRVALRLNARSSGALYTTRTVNVSSGSRSRSRSSSSNSSSSNSSSSSSSSSSSTNRSGISTSTSTSSNIGSGRARTRTPTRAMTSTPDSSTSSSGSSSNRTNSSRGQEQLRRTRNADLPLFYNDVYRVELPPGHRFPMEKYRLVREGLQRELKHEGGGGARTTFSVSPQVSLEDLCTTHKREYVERYFQGQFTAGENRVVGFPWSEASVQRSTSSVGGTVGAMHAVCAGGELRDRLSAGGKASQQTSRPLFAGHIAGGTHHAFWDRGEGFCIFSDIAVAANVALRDYPETISQILIVDCDVHQGNGNAVLFSDKPSVFTFSMHCKANYFSDKQASDVDIEVDEGTGDDEYLRLLSERLPKLIDQVRPDLIFYQGGIDPLVHDRLGRLNLTREGLRRRNRLVYETALARGTPTVITMGGGYPRDLGPSSESFGQIVRSHQDVYADAAECLSASVLGA